MPTVDILIAIAIVISIVVGFARGFFKEVISIGALVAAIWAALNFGPAVGDISARWFASEELQTWFGRALIFLVILMIGGLLGWGIGRLVRMSALSGTDRLLGSVFGAGRGALLLAVFVIGGQFAGFNNDDWWLKSRLIPHAEIVADWIKVMAPKGRDLMLPKRTPGTIPVQAPESSLQTRTS
jgi:membrane protein required for colicin V production